jgi:hypothetical protein
MTISSTTRLAGPYTGTGTTGPFTFAFKVFQASDLYLVKLEISTGAETVLALTTDYTVALNGNQDSNPGGSITLVAALTSAYTLTVTSDIANLQPTDITNQSGFYPEVITDALDRATIQIQQISNIGDRTLKIPVSDGLSLNMELPTATDRANGYLAFTGTGEPSVIAIPTGGLSSLTLTATTASTSNTTGALIVYGGAGIAKDCYINSMFVGTKGVTGATAIGVNAMLSSTGLYSTAFGNSALGAAGATSSCTAVGYAALSFNAGNSNTGVGFQAAYNNAGGSVTAVGYNALFANTQSNCTAVGVDALNTNTASSCTSIGLSAGKTNSGSSLCAVGYQSGFSNTGINSVVIGNNSGYTNTGNYLTAVGQSAGYFNQGASNTAIGYNALSFSTGCTGAANAALGEGALQVNTSGSYNTAIGQRSSYGNTTGNYNVSIGCLAATSLTTGSSNVFIGHNTTAHAAAATNCIVIGQGQTSLANNTTVLGNSSTLATKIFGVQAAGQTAPTITGAATIAPTTSIVYVSAFTGIATITPPTGIASTGGQITIIPTGAFTTVNTGNIAIASTAVVSRAMIMTYCAGTSKWYPSY